MAPDSGPSPSSIPEHFGKYSILGHLATGGMADVYVARQAGLQGFEKIVVIKRVRAELEGDVETTGFFLDEARLVATLEHPNIAQVYEIGLVNGAYFFVMEYVHGADLRQLLDTSARRSKPLALADAIYIVSHVCEALHYAHEKHDLEGRPLQIIHRDVSPSNVLVSHDGAVKLCDFGIAKAQNRSSETQRGMLKGKYAYMSPEQCRCQPLDRRSDLFSIGVILYEATTLTRLYSATNDYDILKSVVEDAPRRPTSVHPGYPVELERIVLRALSKDPDQRYQTAQELQLELEAFAREQKLPQSSVHVAKLMGDLFEKRLEAWARVQKEGHGFEEYLLDTGVRPSGEVPAFMPIGSDEAPLEAVTVRGDATPIRERKYPTPVPAVPAVKAISSPAIAVPPPEPRSVRRRPSALWLMGAIVFALAGAGSVFANDMLHKNAHEQARAALDNDVEKLIGAFDETARTAHMKADAMASTPILRAAIETDAATMKDVLTNEYVFTPAKGESVEIFQTRGGASISLGRLPASTSAIQPLKGGETRVDVVGDHAMITAGAPIASGKSTTAGSVVIASPVDLSAVKRSLEKHATSATIAGFGQPLDVLPSTGRMDNPLEIPLTSTGNWILAGTKLFVTPIVSAAGLWWIPAARAAAFGVATLLLLLYVIGWFRVGPRSLTLG